MFPYLYGDGVDGYEFDEKLTADGILRVAITGRKNSPDLYTIMQLLGEEETLKRLKAAM